MSTPPERTPVFTTPWFQILATPGANGGPAHYAIQSPDFVAIVAVTPRQELVLVRQFRAAVNEITLEIPAGHVEPGETPEQAARKELFEETGYQAENLTLLTSVSLTPARFMNRLWCFFADGASPAPAAQWQPEPGVELVLYRQGLRALLQERDFYSAGGWAALLAALALGKLKMEVST